MQIRPNADTEILRERIFALLNAAPHDASPELLNLLAQYWQKLEVYFGTKMEPWKAGRICEIEWNPPLLEFRIERHPGAWDRVQRWRYDFNSNEARRVSEWTPPQNPSYTKEQVRKDAKQIVNAMLQGEPHPCIERKGEYHRIWMGRLPQTKPVPNDLPQRTAKGRQARLKVEVARQMESHPEFEGVPEEESTGSLVYKRKIIS